MSHFRSLGGAGADEIGTRPAEIGTRIERDAAPAGAAVREGQRAAGEDSGAAARSRATPGWVWRYASNASAEVFSGR